MSPRLGPVEKLVTYGLLGLWPSSVLFPIYYMVLISLKLPKDIYRTPSLLPVGATLKNYVDLLTAQNFLVNIRNSLVVAGAATVVSVFVSCLAAYSLVRLKYRYRGWIGRLILLSYLTPASLLFIPLSVIVARLQLGNTLHGLILIYLTFAAPLSTWLLMGFFRASRPTWRSRRWWTAPGGSRRCTASSSRSRPPGWSPSASSRSPAPGTSSCWR